MAKLLNISLFFFLSLQIPFLSASEQHFGKDQLFGVSLKWYETKKNKGFIKKYLTKNKNQLQGTLDPDCFYKALGNKLCGKSIDKDMLKNIVTLAQKYKAETKGEFNHKFSKKRDFAGLSQGFVIDQLIQQNRKGWAIDFSGDIYISAPIKLKTTPYISDPILDPAPFASVNIKRGWMITSDLNENIPLKNGIKAEERIKRIVLFASPALKGSMLDAWATSIVTGGVPQLRHLLSLKKYKNQWGYLYFNMYDKAHCSSNITCKIKQKANRSVTIKF